MERVLNRLFLEYCCAGDDDVAQWYLDGWEWLEKFYDESKETSQQMAQGTEPILAESRDAELLRSPIRKVHQSVSVAGSQLEASQDHDTGAVSRNSVGL